MRQESRFPTLGGMTLNAVKQVQRGGSGRASVVTLLGPPFTISANPTACAACGKATGGDRCGSCDARLGVGDERREAILARQAAPLPDAFRLGYA